MSGKVYGEAFAIVPEEVLYAEVSPNAKLLWAILERHADPGGHCYPSRKRLAELMRVSEDTVGRAKKELAEAGLLEVEEHYDDAGRRTTDDLFLRGARRKDAAGVRRKDAATRTRAILNERTTTRPDRKNTPGADEPDRLAHERHQALWVAGMNGPLRPTADERRHGLERLRAFREGH